MAATAANTTSLGVKGGKEEGSRSTASINLGNLIPSHSSGKKRFPKSSPLEFLYVSLARTVSQACPQTNDQQRGMNGLSLLAKISLNLDQSKSIPWGWREGPVFDEPIAICLLNKTGVLLAITEEMALFKYTESMFYRWNICHSFDLAISAFLKIAAHISMNAIGYNCFINLFYSTNIHLKIYYIMTLS